MTTPTWFARDGEFSVSAGVVVQDVAGVTVGALVFDAGFVDQRFTATLSSTENGAGVCVHWSDEDNWVAMLRTSAGNWEIRENDGGTETQLATFAASTANGVLVSLAWVWGDKVHAWVDGTQEVANQALSNSNLAAYTDCGYLFNSNAGASTQTMDNVSAARMIPESGEIQLARIPPANTPARWVW